MCRLAQRLAALVGSAPEVLQFGDAADRTEWPQRGGVPLRAERDRGYGDLPAESEGEYGTIETGGQHLCLQKPF